MIFYLSLFIAVIYQLYSPLCTEHSRVASRSQFVRDFFNLQTVVFIYFSLLSFLNITCTQINMNILMVLFSVYTVVSGHTELFSCFQSLTVAVGCVNHSIPVSIIVVVDCVLPHYPKHFNSYKPVSASCTCICHSTP